MLASLVPLPSAAPLHGGAKRKRRQALPLTFLVVEQSNASKVLGAFMLDECNMNAANGDLLTWRCGALAKLVEPQEVSCKSRARSPKLPPQEEIDIRRGLVIGGGVLNDVFSHSASLTWQIWKIDDELLRKLWSTGRTPFTFDTPKSQAVAVGVQPDSPNMLPQPPSTLGETALEHSLDGEIESAIDDGGVEVADGSGLAAVTSTLLLAAQAQRNLETLSGRRGGGCVAATWTARGLLLILQFSKSLKPSVVMADALAAAARLLLLDEGEQLAQLLESEQLKMPTPDFLRAA